MSDNKNRSYEIFQEGLDAWHLYVYEVEMRCLQSSDRKTPIPIPRNPYPVLSDEARAWHKGFMSDRIY